jgi:hypothetical protein
MLVGIVDVDDSIFSTLSCNEFKAITEGPFSIRENLDSQVSFMILSASSLSFWDTLSLL